MIRSIFMKKYFLILAISFFAMSVSVLRAQDTGAPPVPSSPEALEALAKSHTMPWPFSPVVFNYKDENGKWVFTQTTYRKLSPELQNKNWRCWVDVSEKETCMTDQ